MKLNRKKDLTRWNRSGLGRFQYIDGNAITYLETLRQQLVEEYDQAGSARWGELLTRFPELPDETAYQTGKRLNAQYYDDRRDYAWEILRTFARSAHILGEYINAYANEAYLPTAVEWDNVRKLVAMLDYRPSPPASAETCIALLFKANESGEVEQGFAVKNKPGKGESSVIFETRQKLQGSAELNCLRVKNWDRNVSALKQKKSGEIYFYLQADAGDINVGDVGVLATPSEGIYVRVDAIARNAKGDYLKLQLAAGQHINSYRLFNSTLYLQPAFISSPLPNGPDSVTLKQNAGVTAGEILFGNKGSEWHAMRVTKNELRHLQLEDPTGVVTTGEKLYRARSLKRQRHSKLNSNNPLYMLPTDFPSTVKIVVDETLKTLTVTISTQSIDGVAFKFIGQDYGDIIYYPDELLAGEVQQTGQNAYRFAGKAPDLETNSWALVQYPNNSLDAYLIHDISIDREWFSIKLTGLSSAVALLRAAFKLSLRHKDYNINRNKPWTGDSSNACTVVQLDNADLADELTPGQKLICACDTRAVSVELRDIKGSQLYLSPAFHNDTGASAFNRNNTLIYGNVVSATHGETQPEKIVGNGDASQANQRFDLTSDSIAWVADAAFSTGVRADLELRVGQRVWQQVENLSLSCAEDHHYAVEVNEDDMLCVYFGDGRHGRRLPTGIDNVRVRYRNGSGEEGNLEPNKLVKIARPHRLIEDFVAPVAASGGAHKESSASMRDSAPATVLALSRAVSIDDFTHLASHHSRVWQARAFERMPDRPARSRIEVVVVPAGGATFTASSDSANVIRNFLIQHSAPDTPVSVACYQPLYMQLKLSIMVDESAYDKNRVKEAVAAHLLVQLAIKQRKLGQALFRSEVIALLEQVEGVENGHCELLDTPFSSLAASDKPRLHKAEDGGIRKISIQPNQLIYLDTQRYPLQISCLAYEI